MGFILLCSLYGWHISSLLSPICWCKLIEKILWFIQKVYDFLILCYIAIAISNKLINYWRILFWWDIVLFSLVIGLLFSEILFSKLFLLTLLLPLTWLVTIFTSFSTISGVSFLLWFQSVNNIWQYLFPYFVVSSIIIHHHLWPLTFVRDKKSQHFT